MVTQHIINGGNYFVTFNSVIVTSFRQNYIYLIQQLIRHHNYPSHLHASVTLIV